MNQYIHDNTEDEITHFTFINAYLASRGADAGQSRSLPDLAEQQGHRCAADRPPDQPDAAHRRHELVDALSQPHEEPGSRRHLSAGRPGLAQGQFPGDPEDRTPTSSPQDHLQAIANTAGFHFAFIEQGGTSLYPSLAQRVSDAEVLRILLSIGPTETMHFQTWMDKAGNAPALTDPTNGLVFPDLNAPPFGGEDFQTNLIMPEPTAFLSRKFPVCSIIRPTETQGAAMGAVKGLTADGLFIGQSPAFFAAITQLATEADAAHAGT